MEKLNNIRTFEFATKEAITVEIELIGEESDRSHSIFKQSMVDMYNEMQKGGARELNLNGRFSHIKINLDNNTLEASYMDYKRTYDITGVKLTKLVCTAKKFAEQG